MTSPACTAACRPLQLLTLYVCLKHTLFKTSAALTSTASSGRPSSLNTGAAAAAGNTVPWMSNNMALGRPSGLERLALAAEDMGTLCAALQVLQASTSTPDVRHRPGCSRYCCRPC